MPELRIRMDARGVDLVIRAPIGDYCEIQVSDNLESWHRFTSLQTQEEATKVRLDPLVQGKWKFMRVVSHGPTLIYAPGQVVVQFSIEASDEDKKQVMSVLQGDILKRIWTVPMRESAAGEICVYTTPFGVEAAVETVAKHPLVEIAEPNYVYYPQGRTNDTFVQQRRLWGVYGDRTVPANPFGSQACEAWFGNRGSREIVVGVIDTGVQINHPDLAQNIWTNPNEIANNGIDDDGNGYIDDVHGWDFLHNDSSVYDGNSFAQAVDLHGTHVAGTLGALHDNLLGGAGVAGLVSMVPAKFIGQFWGTAADAAEAIDYFTDLAQRYGIPVTALNNSWGGAGYSEVLHAAINRAAKAEILFVAAAGNHRTDNDMSAFWPSSMNTTWNATTESAANYDSVISVAAIDWNGGLAGFSNFGAMTVDLGAPGVGMLSSVPFGRYMPLAGTSMASPHVTGGLVLWANAFPGDSAQSLRSRVFQTAIPTQSLTFRTSSSGRLDLSNVPAAAPAMPAPSNLTARFVAGGRVRLDWTDNSSRETGFEIEQMGVSGRFRRVDRAGRNQSTWAHPAILLPGTYQFRVRAVAGKRTSSYSNTVRIDTPPAPPTNLIASLAPGGTGARLSWRDTAVNEDDFQLERSDNGGPFRVIVTLAANSQSHQDPNLQPGVYSYRVRARRGSQFSAYSNVAVTAINPLGPPPAPSRLWHIAIIGSVSHVNLNWTDNSNSEDGFIIERALDFPFRIFREIGRVGPNRPAYTDSATPAGVYLYRVRAYRGTSFSSYSNTIRVVIP